MRDLWKLKHTLYYDEDGETAENYKLDDNYKVLAKKGQIAERFELNDEVREEYGIWDKMWKTIYVFCNYNYLLCQDDYCDDFVAKN